ncbi:dsRBD fold-containing protein [Kitasatospora sp. NPDC059577]|uniref:dsRBD fold-containing protein n=1 Tax=unclassified Kitasatospora TaxID=2633591 RepID=UPI0036AFF9F4
MTTNTPTPMRTKRWTLRLDLFEEGDTTKVHALLDTGDNTLKTRTTAHRNPHDPPVPEIGPARRPRRLGGERPLRRGLSRQCPAAGKEIRP